MRTRNPAWSPTSQPAQLPLGIEQWARRKSSNRPHLRRDCPTPSPPGQTGTAPVPYWEARTSILLPRLLNKALHAHSLQSECCTAGRRSTAGATSAMWMTTAQRPNPSVGSALLAFECPRTLHSHEKRGSTLQRAQQSLTQRGKSTQTPGVACAAKHQGAFPFRAAAHAPGDCGLGHLPAYGWVTSPRSRNSSTAVPPVPGGPPPRVGAGHIP